MQRQPPPNHVSAVAAAVLLVGRPGLSHALRVFDRTYPSLAALAEPVGSVVRACTQTLPRANPVHKCFPLPPGANNHTRRAKASVPQSRLENAMAG